MKKFNNEKIVMKKYETEKEAENERHCLNMLKDTRRTCKLISSSWKKNYMTCYCAGTLEQKLEKEELNVEMKLNILRQIVLAVCECHECDIAHLDLKLSNVCFSDENADSIKLIDFAHSADVTRPFDKPIVMSWEYISPEVLEINEDFAEGARITSKRLFSVDVWCIGVIIVKMFFPDRIITISDLQKFPDAEPDFSLSPVLRLIFQKDYVERITAFELANLLVC